MIGGDEVVGHKYIARVPDGNGYRYFYTQSEYDAYRKGRNPSGEKGFKIHTTTKITSKDFSNPVTSKTRYVRKDKGAIREVDHRESAATKAGVSLSYNGESVRTILRRNSHKTMRQIKSTAEKGKQSVDKLLKSGKKTSSGRGKSTSIGTKVKNIASKGKAAIDNAIDKRHKKSIKWTFEQRGEKFKMDNNELMHYGVLGMKWGVKRGNASRAFAKASKKATSMNTQSTKLHLKSAKLQNKAMKKDAKATTPKQIAKARKIQVKANKLNLKSAKLQKKAMNWEKKMSKTFSQVKVSDIQQKDLDIGRKYVYMLVS